VTDNSNSDLITRSLLTEYKELRTEARTILILEIISILLAVLVFVSLFSFAVLFKQYILLFLSPIFSVIFIILAMGMLSYSTNLQIRASQIEGQLKRTLGEPTIQWESVVGIFGILGQQSNLYSARVIRQWLQVSILAISVAFIPAIFGLSYWFDQFYSEFGPVAWVIIALDLGVIASTIVLGIRILYRPSWRQ
jgi:hypothetical protein